MVASMGMPGLAGMFGMGGAGGPNPYAGMNPYGGGGMAQPGMPGKGSTKGPGFTIPLAQQSPGFQNALAQMQAWNAGPGGQMPQGMPPANSPWASMVGTGSQTPVPPGAGFQQMPPWAMAQQAQGQPQNYGGILSGLRGGASFGPQQPRGRPQQAKQMAQFRPQQRQPQRRRQTSLVSGPNNGNVLF